MHELLHADQSPFPLCSDLAQCDRPDITYDSSPWHARAGMPPMILWTSTLKKPTGWAKPVSLLDHWERIHLAAPSNFFFDKLMSTLISTFCALLYPCPLMQIKRAVDTARLRAAAEKIPIEFLQVDATAIESSPLAGRTFDVLLDSAMYHGFGDSDRGK
jgi:hypothetical protein